MKSRSTLDLVHAYRSTIVFFAKHKQSVNIMRLDNETSAELDEYLRATVDSVQYVPPHSHRANRAERAIRTAKNHIIATLAGTDAAFPMYEWDAMIPQAELTLNLLRPYSADPTISAYQGLHGHAFNFEQHPIAPFGVKVLIHESPEARPTWAPHGLPGFYLGPALDHHRCFRVYCTSTRAIRISASLAWFPVAFKMPGSSLGELLHASIAALAEVMHTISTSNSLTALARQPFAQHKNDAIASLHALANLFTTNNAQPTTNPHTTPPLAQAQHDRLPTTIPDAPAQRVEATTAIPASAEQRVPSIRVATPEPASHAPSDAVPQPRHRRIRQQLTATIPITLPIVIPPDDTVVDADVAETFVRRSTRQVPARAMHAPSEPIDPAGCDLHHLNLDDSGQPLRFPTAIKGPDGP
jgi:hypothetical protein